MAIQTVADVHVRWNSKELEAEVERGRGRGLKAAAIFLAARVREVLSVPAPRVRVDTGNGIEYRAGWLSGKGGVVQEDISPFERNDRMVDVLRRGKIERDVFTPSPATPFAPPRKLSGHGRRSVGWEINDEGTEARVGTNVDYMADHERGNHKWLMPTLTANMNRLAQVIGDSATAGPGRVVT